jgi:hypothetical protein
MYTYSVFADFFQNIYALFAENEHDSSIADFMHTYSAVCRPDADLMLTDSMHTLCRVTVINMSL